MTFPSAHVEKDGQAVHLFLAFDTPDRIGWNCPGCKQSFNMDKGRAHRHQVSGGSGGPWS